MRRAITILATLSLVAFSLGCESQGTDQEPEQPEQAQEQEQQQEQTGPEQAADQTGEEAEQAGEALEEAGEEAVDEAEQAGQKIEEAGEEAGEEIEQAVGVDDDPDEQQQTLTDAINERDELSTLADALESAELTDALSGEGPYTVFAPSDDAFEQLPEGRLDELQSEERRPELQDILKYHVVSGKVTSEAAEEGEVETLQGSKAEITMTEDDEIKYSGGTVEEADIEASNGVIHVIDQVVMPPQEGRSM